MEQLATPRRGKKKARKKLSSKLFLGVQVHEVTQVPEVIQESEMA